MKFLTTVRIWDEAETIFIICRQEARFNMYNAVVTCCQVNNAIVALVPAFQTAANNLKDVYNDIFFRERFRKDAAQKKILFSQ